MPIYRFTDKMKLDIEADDLDQAIIRHQEFKNTLEEWIKEELYVDNDPVLEEAPEEEDEDEDIVLDYSSGQLKCCVIGSSQYIEEVLPDKTLIKVDTALRSGDIERR